MKSNIAPKVAVCMALATAIFAFSIQIAAANDMLKNLKWMLPYLWGASIFFVILAVALSIFSVDKTNEHQDSVRDVLHLHGQVSFGELMSESKLSESVLRKTLRAMRNTDELTTWTDSHGREMWRFRIHVARSGGRFQGRF